MVHVFSPDEPQGRSTVKEHMHEGQMKVARQFRGCESIDPSLTVGARITVRDLLLATNEAGSGQNRAASVNER